MTLAAVIGGLAGGAARLALRARRTARERLAELETLALPQRCPGCGDPADAGRLLCDRCWARVPRLGVVLCVRCLARERDPSACTGHPGFRFWAARVYDDRAARVVQAFKFGERRRLAHVLGGALAEALPMDYRPDLVLDVPLHPVRRRERGYNQAALLADVVAARLGVPRLPNGLERVRPTPAQAGLSGRARRRNLESAFAATQPRALRGRKALIVDDVVTTGSTLEACMATLEGCGAHAVGAAFAWAS